DSYGGQNVEAPTVSGKRAVCRGQGAPRGRSAAELALDAGQTAPPLTQRPPPAHLVLSREAVAIATASRDKTGQAKGSPGPPKASSIDGRIETAWPSSASPASSAPRSPA